MPIRLTEEHQRRLFQHIKDKWGEHCPCPMCGQLKWSVDGSIYRLAALSTATHAAHSLVQPLATIRCTHCSNVVLIHLTQSGIVDPDDLNLEHPAGAGASVQFSDLDIDENDDTK